MTLQFPAPPDPVISAWEGLGAGAHGLPVPVVPVGHTGPGTLDHQPRVITEITCVTITALPAEGPGPREGPSAPHPKEPALE